MSFLYASMNSIVVFNGGVSAFYYIPHIGFVVYPCFKQQRLQKSAYFTPLRCNVICCWQKKLSLLRLHTVFLDMQVRIQKWE
jgi:hypothetical protein